MHGCPSRPYGAEWRSLPRRRPPPRTPLQIAEPFTGDLGDGVLEQPHPVAEPLEDLCDVCRFGCRTRQRLVSLVVVCPHADSDTEPHGWLLRRCHASPTDSSTSTRLVTGVVLMFMGGTAPTVTMYAPGGSGSNSMRCPCVVRVICAASTVRPASLRTSARSASCSSGTASAVTTNVSVATS